MSVCPKSFDDLNSLVQAKGGPIYPHQGPHLCDCGVHPTGKTVFVLLLNTCKALGGGNISSSTGP